MHSVSLHPVQVAATNFITELGAKHTEQMKLCLPLIVPVLSGAVADSKLQVKVRRTSKTISTASKTDCNLYVLCFSHWIVHLQRSVTCTWVP